MANTFLKRKITAKRLWELYSSRIPIWGHLFLALSGFSLILTSGSSWTEEYYEAIPLAGPVFILFKDSIFTLPPLFWGAVTAFGVTTFSILLSFLGISPPLAALWAFIVMCGTVLFPLSQSLPLESLMIGLWGILSILACKLRYTSDVRLNCFFAVMLILAVLFYLPSILLVPLFCNFALGKKIPCLRKRVFYSVIIGITSMVALGGVSLIGNILFWDSISMISLKELPLALWTLLCSPGRSVLLYSLPLLLAISGYRHMLDDKPDFARFYTGVVVVSTTGVILLGGDYCRQAWSGEPMIAFLPLFMVPAAWVNLRRNITAWFAAITVCLAILCQAILFTPVELKDLNLNEHKKVYMPSQSPVFRYFVRE